MWKRSRHQVDHDPLAQTKWQAFCFYLRRLRFAPKAPRRGARLTRALAIATLIGGTTTAVVCLVYLHELDVFADHQQSLNTIVAWQPSDNSLVYDRDGNKIAELFSQYHIYMPYEQLPGDLIKAITAIEDRDYWHHAGIDPKGMLRAAVAHIKGGEQTYRQGASTITQQLVRHFLLAKEKTIDRKIKEIFLALQLEGLASKEKIIELYANALFLGFGSYGVGAAAQRYFAKPLGELQLHELALISGLFQSPSRYNPHRYPERAKKRQLRVLKAMHATGLLSRGELKTWSQKPLVYAPYNPTHGTYAPYFVDYVDEQARLLLKVPSLKNQGYRITTTLDPQLQQLAEDAIIKAAPNLAPAEAQTKPIRQADGSWFKPKLEAALLATDPRTGEVLAMVGGRDYNHSQFNRTTQAYRQPGSAFKPIVYSLALLEGFRWSDIIYVSPITVAGHYRPKTPEKDYLTETTLLRAFYRSMNTPTVELGEKLGLDKVIDYAKRLGMQSPMKKEFGTVLGASEATMLELARVNSVFAHAGRLVDQIAIRSISDRSGKVLYEAPPLMERQREVITPQLAYVTTQGMRQVLARGTATRAGHLSRWAAGKTGTSNDSKDNWFTGFTSNLVGIVWVGTDESTPIGGYAQGGTLALPIWQNFMEPALVLHPPKDFVRPPRVQSEVIHPLYGYRSPEGVSMWFLEHAPPSALRAAPTGKGDISKLENFRDPFAQ